MGTYRFLVIAVVIKLFVPTAGMGGEGQVTKLETLEQLRVRLSADKDYQLPEWFEGNRVQAHTRLGFSGWGKKPIFYNTAESFKQMGITAYTRHVKSYELTALWPSKVGVVIPEAKEFNITQKLIDNAHDRGMRMIAYYRHMSDNASAEKHPEWKCRSWDGKIILEAGKNLNWLCLNTDYREFVKTRLLELADMGADGIYFDYIHMPRWLGKPKYIDTCYCQTCRKKFEKIYGRKMPEKVKHDDPVASLFVEFYNRTLIETFGEWVQTVNQRKPDCVMIVSCTFVPGMHSPLMSSRLPALVNSPKTEWNLPCIWPQLPKDVLRPDDDMRWAAGFTYLRGACDDRSPHVWLYPLWAKEEALSAASGCMTYGLIANIDVMEAEIPNMTYAPAYELGKKVSPYLKRTKPMRWAVIHYDEKLRDDLWPDVEKIWKQALWPAYGPFEALCRARLPVAYVNDWQLEAGQLDGYKVLILPHPDHLTAAQQKQVAKFKSVGGIVIETDPDTPYYDSKQHDQCVKKFFEQYQQLAPEAPIKVTGGPEDLHTVAWKKRDGSATTVCLLNKFRWFSTHGRHRKVAKEHPELLSTPPPPANNVVVTLRSEGGPKKVFDAVTGKELSMQKNANGWQVKVPEFPFMAAVVFEW